MHWKKVNLGAGRPVRRLVKDCECLKRAETVRMGSLAKRGIKVRPNGQNCVTLWLWESKEVT